MDTEYDQNHLRILKEELIVALGCTEPIAIAYAAARARDLLGAVPERCSVRCSGNIIKNVMGVTVPNSGGMRGVATAAILGIVGGEADRELEVLESVTDEHRARALELSESDFCTCELVRNVANLYIETEVWGGGHQALVEIQNTHKNITHMVKDGKELPIQKIQGCTDAPIPKGDRSLLTLKNIVEFADEVSVDEIAPILEPQIKYNMAICEEGLAHPYGAEVGRVLLDGSHEPTIGLRARAYAAAGSDARMGGCPLPVVINSGSGNQGITVSVPVVIYAREYQAPREKLLRALTVSNLVAILQKRYIGSLSAYCGVVSAACGAACGICYLLDYPYSVLCDTVTNTIATVSGMVCDGAKSSCAAKISTALQTALLGIKMGLHHCSFQPGEGLVDDNVETTIRNVGRMGREGMKSTDLEILNIMLGK